jgi:hypothetical protein
VRIVLPVAVVGHVHVVGFLAVEEGLLVVVVLAAIVLHWRGNEHAANYFNDGFVLENDRLAPATQTNKPLTGSGRRGRVVHGKAVVHDGDHWGHHGAGPGIRGHAHRAGEQARRYRHVALHRALPAMRKGVKKNVGAAKNKNKIKIKHTTDLHAHVVGVGMRMRVVCMRVWVVARVLRLLLLLLLLHRHVARVAVAGTLVTLPVSQRMAR